MVKTKWMWVDWLIFSLRCGWYLTGAAFYYVNLERLGDLGFANFLLFVSIAFIMPLLFWNPWFVKPQTYTLTELIITSCFSIYINNIAGIALSTSILLMPILMSGYLLTRQSAPWAVPAFIILLPANRYWTIDSMFSFFLQYIDVLLFFCIGVGFNLITKSQKKYKRLLDDNLRQFELIEQQNRALSHYAEEIEKLALVEERNRMARDLHDSIGHHFTSLTVGLDAVQYMLDSHPHLAARQIEQLADLARGGLTEVRRTIHDIAPSEDDLPLSVQLENLVRAFSHHTDTKTKWEVHGEEAFVPAHVKITLIRCLQESMTNAKKHGGATYIHICLTFHEQMITLTVFNNGKQIHVDHDGFGLRSMKNRMQQLNGVFAIQNEEDGVSVTCTLPLRRMNDEENQATSSG